MRRRRLTDLERRSVYERAGGCCEYCRHPFEYAPGIYQVDHIISLASGGSNDLANLALACDACNTLKWMHIQWIDPKTGLETPLFNPRIQKWSAHFRWSEDWLLVHGTSPEGRATVDLLQLNRTGLINSRRALLAIGAHPGAGPG